MKKVVEKVDCPHCLFSSGFTPFIRGSNVCYLCNGTGSITKSILKNYEK